ncbi:hypothetical protein BD311DRAFT_689048 [Dichomitus squalens]|uniref:Uncharacterized protein n=1 Tax=Dichomitus squalens TaxID=114155 RepID=A0A4Q9MXY7_9APHY|nr:hypothetical protein BD311DRAFT_689048 [Dichomitus squalens]
MARRFTVMPPIVCTGYELTDALRRYLEVGHGVDFDKVKAVTIEQDKELCGDEYNEADEEALAPEREAVVVDSFQKYFSRVRRGAPAEVRKALEIPYSYSKWIDGAPKIYMFVPTGAYIREGRTSGVLKTPRDEDLKVIQAFIDAANGLLPEAVRDEASFKLDDVHFEVHTPGDLLQPVYKRDERKELLPPRHLRALFNVPQ